MSDILCVELSLTYHAPAAKFAMLCYRRRLPARHFIGNVIALDAVNADKTLRCKALMDRFDGFALNADMPKIATPPRHLSNIIGRWYLSVLSWHGLHRRTRHYAAPACLCLTLIDGHQSRTVTHVATRNIAAHHGHSW